MNTFVERYGAWALITGASSGIGAEFAHQLAKLGMNVALVARREARLVELANWLEQEYDISAVSIPLDLTTQDFLDTLLLATNHMDIGLVINNAGFGRTAELVDDDLSKQLDMLNLNCRTPLVLSSVYGQRMKVRGKGGIINISSITAFSGAPRWSNYAASKSYDLVLSEGLYGELKPYGVDVLAVCPGTTRTEFHDNSGTSGGFFPMDVDVVVQKSLQCLGKRPLLIPGIINKLMVFAMRFSPRWLNAKIVGNVVQNITND